MVNIDIGIDQLKSLSIAETEINNNIKNITNLSSVIKTCTSNYTDFTTNITDLSNHFTDLSTNFNDFSTNLNNITNNTADLSTTNNLFINMGNSVELMNDKLKATDTSTEKASSGLGKLVKSALSLGNISKGMDMVDKYINTGNGLSRVNDGLQTQMELQNKVNAAANRSSISYSDMADAVSNVGSLGTFKSSNDQAIAFTELMQKTLKVEGSDKTVTNVADSMSDGVLKGDEFSSLISSAPMIGEALSTSTGKSSKQLQEMAEQGAITADLLKTAMFAASDEINTEFDNQPKTFSDIWTKITNSAMNALNPLMQLVSDVLNSPGIQAAINVIISLLGLVSQAVNSLIGFIVDNWAIIQPILIAAGIFLAYLGAVAFAGFMQAAVAELAALAPLLVIIAIIAAIIYVLQFLGVSFEDIFGFIGGVVGVAIAGIWNLFLGLFEFVLGIINSLINPFVNIANFVGNIFTSPISSIIYLFQGLADNVLGVIESIASALDFVFGTKMAETVSGWRSGIKDMADAAVKEYAPDEDYQKVMDNMNLSTDSLGLDRMDYSDTFGLGKGMGKKAYSGLEGALGSMSNSDPGIDLSGFTPTNEPSPATDPIPVEGTGPNGTVAVDMEDEDLGYLRDMAERDYIANVASNTLAPNISVSFGDVHETADVDQMFGRIRTILREQIAIAPEGVY
jgi:tape measure domain-containing protein